MFTLPFGLSASSMVHAGGDENVENPKDGGRNAPSPSRHTPTLFGGVICRCYDQDGVPAPGKSVYEKNRPLFLMQSCLLGISYSIIWPTLWKLVTKEFTVVYPNWRLILYGTTFVGYPLASMLTAHLVQKMSIRSNTRMMFLLLNVTQIVGNLMYAINFHPAFLFFGRFVSGVGDAFFVVIMADTRITRNYKDGSVAAQCLTTFIIGLLLAQALNIVCIYIPFYIGNWSLQVWNFPPLAAAILFCIVGASLFGTLDLEGLDTHVHITAATKQPDDPTDSGPGFSSLFVCFFSFVHTFIISMLEILIPMFIYQRLEMGVVIAVLLYIFLIILYAMILIFTMSIDSPLMLEFSLIISVVLKMVALLCVVLMTANALGTLGCIFALIVVMMSVGFMWSNEDVMYTNLILTLVAYRHREKTNDMRKTASKFSFVFSGLLVPFFFHHVSILWVSSALIVVVGLLFGMFVTLRMFGRALRKD